MNRLLVILLFSLLGLAACASSPPSAARQKQTTEKVALNAATNAEPTCQAGHEGALNNGTISIKPGEVICVRLKVMGKLVVPEHIVKSGDPTDLLVIRLWQEPGDKATYLYIHNPLDKFLVYDAAMLDPLTITFQHTSTCPVLSHRVGLEQWPYPIDTLLLANFATIPEDSDIVCN